MGASLEVISGGSMELANGSSAQEMQRNLAEMQAKINMVQQFIQTVMKEGLDHGVVPGTGGKRSLFQPGADKLNSLYGFSRHIVSKDERKDYNTGEYEATVKVRLIHMNTGVIVGEGEGSCSTMETKYKYRWMYERDLPRGIDKETLSSKYYEGKDGKPGHTKYRMENADLFDVWNTVLKMAIKRAYLSATLAATGLSGIFQQDEEDFDAWVEDDGNAEPKQKKAPPGRGQTPNNGQGARPAGNGGGGGRNISEKQYAMIMSRAKEKGLDEYGVKTLVQSIKGKALSELSISEASSVIEFIIASDKDDLQNIVFEAATDEGGRL